MPRNPRTSDKENIPTMITFAAVAQLLIALAFVSIPLVRHRYGAGAKATAEAELERQGVPTAVLAENKISFDVSGHETAVPVIIAVVMTALAVLNFSGSSLGQLLTWIFQSIVLVGNGVILYSNLTAVESVRAAFAKKGDPVLQRVDVRARLKAAESGFPTWVARPPEHPARRGVRWFDLRPDRDGHRLTSAAHVAPARADVLAGATYIAVCVLFAWSGQGLLR